MAVERDVESELSIINKMITALVEVLEEKGVITNEEWEKRIQQKIMEAINEE